MKWEKIALLSAILILLLAVSHCFAEEHAAISDKETETFILPSSLQLIEESAFEGVAASTVYLPDGFETLQDRAFAGAQNLKTIFIPASTISIGKDALPHHSSVEIHGIKGSYAQRWAKKHGFTFVHDDIWACLLENGKSRSYIDIELIDYNGDHSDKNQWRKNDIAFIVNSASKPPKERPEMYPLDYDFP